LEIRVVFHHLQCQIIRAVLRHFLLMVAVAGILGLAMMQVVLAVEELHLLDKSARQLLAVLVEHGRGLVDQPVVPQEHRLLKIPFTAAAAAAAALLLLEVQVAIHIMVAAAQVMFPDLARLSHPHPALQFTAVVVAVQLQQELVLRALEVQVNLAVLAVLEFPHQLLYQEQFHQVAAVAQEQEPLPARVQQVKFV
jgi:hypothetical protein